MTFAVRGDGRLEHITGKIEQDYQVVSQDSSPPRRGRNGSVDGRHGAYKAARPASNQYQRRTQQKLSQRQH